MLDFTAVDIETASNLKGSICALGMVRVRNGLIVDRYYSLVNPACDFNRYNTKINGICERDVVNAPVFAQIADEVLKFIGSDALAMHNASFDLTHLREAFALSARIMPEADIIDTLLLIRDVHPELPDFKLTTACVYYHIPAQRHHNALADAEMCAQLAVAIDQDTAVVPCAIKPQQKAQMQRKAEREALFQQMAQILEIREKPTRMLRYLREACPDVASELHMPLIDNGTQYVLTYRSMAVFSIIMGKNEPYIRISEVENPKAIAPTAYQYVDGTWKLTMNGTFNLKAFIASVAKTISTMQ